MEIVVIWTGQYPNHCRGEWILFIDNKDYSYLIPFRKKPADTFGTYTRWYFNDKWNEEWEEYEDGMTEYEWITNNIAWLEQLPNGVSYKDIYNAFQEKDWRHNQCGGCI